MGFDVLSLNVKRGLKAGSVQQYWDCIESYIHWSPVLSSGMNSVLRSLLSWLKII